MNHICKDIFCAIHNAEKYPLTYLQGPPGYFDMVVMDEAS